MKVVICTDMEGLTGLHTRDQCSPESPDNPLYQEGRWLLTREINVAAEACSLAGAQEINVADGHGYRTRTGQPNLLIEKLDPRVLLIDSMRTRCSAGDVDALLIIGQHAMAGTLNGFIDHTGSSKRVCRFLINGIEHGELGYAALYAGYFGIPLVYVSGDKAACDEATRMFPHTVTTPTKIGTGWATCELFPAEEVHVAMKADIQKALSTIDRSKAYRLPGPLEVAIEFAWTELADRLAAYPNVRRPHPRTVSWKIATARDIYCRPGPDWSPPDL